MNAMTRQLRIMDAVGLSAMLLLAAAVYVVGVQPIHSQYQQRQLQREHLVTQRAEAAEMDRHLTRLRGQWLRAEAAVAEHTLRLEPVSALNRRVAALAELAQQCGLTVEQVRPGEAIAGRYYQTVPIELVGQGSYSDSSLFLNRLHQVMPDVATASIALRSGAGRSGPGTFVLHLRWYAEPPVGG